MDNIDKVFNEKLWGENFFDPAKYQSEGAEEKVAKQGLRKWHVIVKMEELLQRITGVFWSDSAAETGEDLPLVADLRHYYEELKGSEKRLSEMGRKGDRDKLAEARQDWENVSEKLRKLKLSYSHHPRISRTASYQKLATLEKKIDTKIKQFVFRCGDPKAAREVKSAEDFLHRFALNREIFRQEANLLKPAQEHLEALKRIVEYATPEFISNPFNKDLQVKAKELFVHLRQKMISTYLESRGGGIQQEVKTFVATHAQQMRQLTPDIKSLLKFSLNALRRDDPERYYQAVSQLNVLEEDAYLDFLSALLKEYVDRRPGFGLKALYSQVTEDLATIRKIPVMQSLNQVLASVAGLKEALNLIKIIEELAATKLNRDHLRDQIQPAGHVDNLLLLAEKLQPFEDKPYAAQALKELDTLQKNALEVRFEGLSAQGKAQLTRVQSLAGKDFPLPLTAKLALVACLYDQEFLAAFTKLLDSYGAVQLESLQEGYREGIQRESGLGKEAVQAWFTRLTEPFASLPIFQQKMKALGSLEYLLGSKVGLSEPLTLAESVMLAVMDEKQFQAHPALGRPLRQKNMALRNLERFSESEQLLFQKKGITSSKQLGCFEYCQCEPFSASPFNARGERHFKSGTFTLGYAIPGVGAMSTKVALDLSNFQDLEPVQLFQLIKACLDTDERGIAEEFKKRSPFCSSLILRVEKSWKGEFAS